MQLKVVCHVSAVGATGVTGEVFFPPVAGELTGAKIGKFEAAAFESAAESGKAVLLVDVTDFGGEALTTADTPVVIFEGVTASGSPLGNAKQFGSVSVHEATVIEA
jgi:hypothetical protein